MRIVLDASVAIASERPLEPGHQAARARIVRVLSRDDEIVVPPIFAAEVAGALVRRGHKESNIRAYLAALTAKPNHVKTFGPRASRLIADIALRSRLRGADACYVWLSIHDGLPFCTLDREIAHRAGPLCSILAP